MRTTLRFTLTLLLLASPAAAGELFEQDAIDFSKQVDLACFRRLSVQLPGRIGTFDTFARQTVSNIYGRGTIDGVSPDFAFLELYLNSGAYLNKPLVQVDSSVRGPLLELMPPGPARDALDKAGRLPPQSLMGDDEVRFLLILKRVDLSQIKPPIGRTRTDVAKLAAAQPKLTAKLQRIPARLEAFAAPQLRIVPVDPGRGAWQIPEALAASRAADSRTELGPELTEWLNKNDLRFQHLGAAWRQRDAASVNRLLGDICQDFTARAAGSAPPTWRVELELVYNRFKGYWLAIGLLALSLSLTAVSRKRPQPLQGARRAARPLALWAFLTAGMVVVLSAVARWIVSGRGWALPPLTNQYETVLAVALFVLILGGVLELFIRSRVFLVAAGIVAVAVLTMLLVQLGPVKADITPPADILVSPVLGYHVATIMLGYAAIAMSLEISLAYLGLHLVNAFRKRGATEEIPPASPSDLPARLDRANIILVQIATFLVAVGVVLGAYWADLSWGRWWGWDPKETWALMTLLVYIAIIHLRLALPEHRRALWTAALAVLGCLVMLVTWWAVNYLMPGLHSYA